MSNEILGKLIEQLALKEKVVVLIDEYDNPLKNRNNHSHSMVAGCVQ